MVDTASTSVPPGVRLWLPELVYWPPDMRTTSLNYFQLTTLKLWEVLLDHDPAWSLLLAWQRSAESSANVSEE